MTEHAKTWAWVWGSEPPAFSIGYDLGIGTHRHVHAANLAIRADAYERVGGFPAVEHQKGLQGRDIFRGGCSPENCHVGS